NLFEADRTSRSADVRARGSAVRAGSWSPGPLASGFETPPPHAASAASASGAQTRFIHEFDDDIPPPRTLVSTRHLTPQPAAAVVRHLWNALLLDATIDWFSLQQARRFPRFDGPRTGAERAPTIPV